MLMSGVPAEKVAISFAIGLSIAAFFMTIRSPE
jgi:hypothetical protein